MNEELIDKRAIMQILGSLIKNPTLLDEYNFERTDFCENFYTLVYSVIFNLYATGITVIDAFSIDSYISNFNEQYKIFNDNNGLEYVNSAIELSEEDNFSYYYKRLKKFSYLRYLETNGYDSKKIYNYSITDPSGQEKEMLKLDNLTVEDMIDTVDDILINEAKMKYSSNTNHIGQSAGKDLKTLVKSFKEEPDFGLPLQSPLMSTIARGCRLKKIYIRSSDSGGGKTRTGIADMANISIPYFYDHKLKKWIYTGMQEPVLVISSELEIPEVQTIIVAYVSGVNESHIREGRYEKGEDQIVKQAIEYIECSPFYIEFIPNFKIADIEHLIKKYKREKSVFHFFFDYIHMSSSLIMEVAQMTSGMRLREDQILFLFVDTLKNLCNTLGIFILTSTQLNGTYKDSTEKDETMLRGAKSMADRIDLGEISLAPSPADIKLIDVIMKKMIGIKKPNLIRSIYKLRANKWSKIKVFQYVDLGTGRTTDLFALDRNNKLIDIDVTKIELANEEDNGKVEKIIEDNSVAIDEMPEDLDLRSSENQNEDAEETNINVTGKFIF